MAAGSPPDDADSPATLYGPVSLVLGVAALLTLVVSGVIGPAIPLLTGSLAVTFAILGLAAGRNRGKCAVGLATGSAGLLYPILLIVAWSL